MLTPTNTQPKINKVQIQRSPADIKKVLLAV